MDAHIGNAKPFVLVPDTQFVAMVQHGAQDANAQRGQL